MPPPATLKVVEVFASVQGEGLRLGEPTIFVRLAGCNLRCRFCDTRRAWKGGREMTLDQVEARVLRAARKFPCRWVCLTGGEPLAQDVSGLVRILKRRGGFSVQVETNGTQVPVPAVDWYSVSPKPPAYAVRPGLRSQAREVKIVVTHGLDLDRLKRIRRAFPRGTPVMLQPQSGAAWSVRRAIALLRLSLFARLPNIRLSPQAQRYWNLP